MLRIISFLILPINLLALYKAEHVDNVGTVLFTTRDLEKKQWTSNDIALLKARRYFQNLLPPPLFVSNLNEHFIDMLFKYFKETYAAIKDEIDDPNMDTLMTKALSDSIGGYLKAWVLPLTKFAYYGGTMSDTNVTRLFTFYHEIKTYLNTDGEGWHKPKTNLFEVAIHSGGPEVPVKTKGADPCDQFVYFEKTPDGLNVPIPRISWDGPASKLFLPLKNQSIYAMNSADSSSVLLKYHGLARYCLQQRYPSMLPSYDARLQLWLANEVLPHLKDDTVYLALGSVLTMINRTGELFENIYVSKQQKGKLVPSKNHFFHPHAYYFQMFKKYFQMSKKMMVLALVMTLEVVWCCIALIYMCCVKRKKNQSCNVGFFLPPRPSGKDCGFNTQDINCKMNKTDKAVNIKSCSDKSITGVKLNVKAKGKGRRKSKVECATDAYNVVTQSVEVLTQSDLKIKSSPELYKKKLKRDSSQHQRSVGMGFNVNYTPEKMSNNTVDITVSKESHRRSKHSDKKGKRDKKEKSQRKTEPQKSSRDDKDSSAKGLGSKLRRGISDLLKSELLINTANMDIERSITEKSIDTAEFLRSSDYFPAVGIQNVPLILKSSKAFNTELGTSHHVKNDECQCTDAVETSAGYTNTENTVNTVSFSRRSNTSITAESHDLFDILNISKVDTAHNIEDIEVGARCVINDPINIVNDQSTNLITLISERLSTRTLELQNVDLPRGQDTRIQQMAAFPSHQMLERDCKDESSIKVQPEMLTPKRSMQIEPVQEMIQISSSSKKRKQVKDLEKKRMRVNVQKEGKGVDLRQLGETYWDILIDEPDKDVYVDIKGVMNIDCKNLKRSKIPKLTVRSVEAPSHTTGVTTLSPRPNKKASHDLVLTTDKGQT